MCTIMKFSGTPDMSSKYVKAIGEAIDVSQCGALKTTKKAIQII